MSTRVLFLLIGMHGVTFTDSAHACPETQRKLGALFLHRRQPSKYLSPEIQKTMRLLNASGHKNSKDTVSTIAAWLKVLEKTHLSHQGRPEIMQRIKEHYFKKYVVKSDEIPESYFKLQQRIAREQGHGYLQIDAATRKRLSEILIRDQRVSLDSWLNYFLSPETDSYPMWAKVWAFEGLVKLGKLDMTAEAWEFSQRGREQTAPFPELNREALAKVMDVMKKHVSESGEHALEPELTKLAERGNFGQLYAYFLKKVQAQTFDPRVTKGEWRKFSKGSDPSALVRALDCRNTGWCTAAEGTAATHLQAGDFYVYFSNNHSGEPVQPRIAIRMEENKIAEVRGIGKEQHFDSEIANTDILDQKLTEFGSGGQKYKKRSANMKRLTQLDKKHQAQQELTIEELKFLYEIDETIEGFGYEKDPRIQEIIRSRSPRKDLAKIFDVSENKISLTQEEALSGGVVYHYGNLDLNTLRSVKGLKLPERLSGDINLGRFKSAKGLKLPKHIGGHLDLSGCKSVEGLKLPDYVGGNLELGGLESAEGLKLPKHIGGNLQLSALTSAEGLNLPKYVGGDIELLNLTSALGLKFPNHLEGSLFLSSLESTEGLQLPDHIDGDLYLDALRSAKGLKLPDHIGGDLNLAKLRSAKGLKLPARVGGLDLSRLTSAEGLKLPNHIGGDLNLASLSSAQNLHLPEHVGGSLILTSLTSAKGLKLPKSVVGGYDLDGLLSAEGLELPEQISGYLYLSGLKSAKGLKLPRRVEKDLSLDGLTSPEGLELPGYLGGNLYLRGLTSTKGLKLPSHIGGEIYIPTI